MAPSKYDEFPSMGVEDHLRMFHERHGEEAWRSEVRRLAIAGIRTGPKHEAFWQEHTRDFDWLDWDELKLHALSEQIPGAPDQMLAEMLRRQMPGIKTQAQYDVVVGALDAVRVVLTHILNRDSKQEAEARAVLEKTFDAARVATELTHKLEDVPEATTSSASEQFKKPPAQFEEQAVVQKLMGELRRFETREGLNIWYAQTKSERDRVVTQSLRNTLLDAIRAKGTSL